MLWRTDDDLKNLSKRRPKSHRGAESHDKVACFVFFSAEIFLNVLSSY